MAPSDSSKSSPQAGRRSAAIDLGGWQRLIMKLRSEEDALGQAIYSQHAEGTGCELIERDDGACSPKRFSGHALECTSSAWLIDAPQACWLLSARKQARMDDASWIIQ